MRRLYELRKELMVHHTSSTNLGANCDLYLEVEAGVEPEGEDSAIPPGSPDDLSSTREQKSRADPEIHDGHHAFSQELHSETYSSVPNSTNVHDSKRIERHEEVADIEQPSAVPSLGRQLTKFDSMTDILQHCTSEEKEELQQKVVEGKKVVLPVHRAILSARCEFFHKLLSR